MRGSVAVAVLWSALVPMSVWAQPTMLLTEERLAQEAVLIGGVVSRHIHQAIFPDIKFTCPGNLSKWALVAEPFAGSRYPEVHVWRSSGSARRFVRYKRNKLSASSPNPVARVYEAIRDPPLVFEAGDILGVYNPTVPALAFRYQQNGGPLNYYTLGDITARDTFDLDARSYVVHTGDNYPLVSVQVDPPECASGFLDYATLVRKASLLIGDISSNLQYQESTQRVIPALEFPASGLVHHITIGAAWDPRENDIPEIQLWRSTGQGSWRKSVGVSSNADITPNIALNVHRYTPFTPLEVQAGDVLGFYQPSSSRSRFRIYMVPGGPDNYIQYSTSGPLDTISEQDREDALPLITVNFTEVPPSSTPTSPVTGKSEGSSTTASSVTCNSGNSSTTGSPVTGNSSTTASSVTCNSGNSSTTGSPVTGKSEGSSTTASSVTGKSDNSSSTTVIVSVTVTSVIVITPLGTVMLGLLYCHVWNNTRPRPYSRAAPHRYDLPTHIGPKRPPPPPSSYNSSQMEYNVNYTHKNPSVVITNGRKQTLDLVHNSAYGTDSTSLPIPVDTTFSLTLAPTPTLPVNAVNPLSDRAYEEVSDRVYEEVS